MYRDYERAFTAGTGLPLRMRQPEMMQVVRYPRDQQNPFWALLAKSNQVCAQRYALQQELDEEAQLEPKTLKCFAGLCETAVPGRVGEKLIAFLQTGQVLLHSPEKAQFNEVAETLLKSGSDVDLKRLEEAYFSTCVLTEKQFQALARLLEIFAGHLAECGNALSLQGANDEPAAIARARRYIHDHSDEELSLATVPKVVNMSASYFSEKFKEATSPQLRRFCRSHVEPPRESQSPNHRDRLRSRLKSLSQFNRAFRRVTGKAPSDYRAALAAV